MRDKSKAIPVDFFFFFLIYKDLVFQTETEILKQQKKKILLLEKQKKIWVGSKSG